ncbi:CpsD/CapB family tyrosine-protein kinase [Planococcus citreus]|uniref:non-specific protein-tyrosine kinase n=1 Tax=Planococcus citreus TaxID=1373 RepID=A0A497YM66_9BACL|nr:CpsD/CapB family tyrosine-protein kinase [Planococcus citreus]RLJ90591.1 capsular exopolysaccharide synthesis family protein [Planococcus citreus]
MMIKRKNRIDNELVVATTPHSHISEEFRRLRTNLNLSSVPGEFRSLLVASSAEGEGRSMVAANLAVVYAQQGKKVLLVDGDLRNPTANESFGLKNKAGLSTILEGRMGMEAAIQKNAFENLDLLSSGPVPSNPSELLSSDTMAQLMDRMAKTYGIVIFDSPPLLKAVDAQIIANKCDGSILVIHSGATDRKQVLKAQEILASSGSQLIGVILNNFKPVPAKSFG